MPDSTADILRRARDHIAQAGMWFQGNFFPAYDEENPTSPPDDAPCCAFGATAWALGDAPGTVLNAADIMLIKALEHNVPEWNDDPDRTQPEVVALFDRAIELAEKEASDV